MSAIEEYVAARIEFEAASKDLQEMAERMRNCANLIADERILKDFCQIEREWTTIEAVTKAELRRLGAKYKMDQASRHLTAEQLAILSR